jgi:uncharacterized membrane protein
MVLEMKVPHDADLAALWSLWAALVGYIVSFIYVSIYWNKCQSPNKLRIQVC